jgi:hypothetical protein
MRSLNTRPVAGYPDTVLGRAPRPACGVGTCVLSLSSVWLCVNLWIRAGTVDQDERGNAERRALFVGLWPPMLWLMGDAPARRE